MHRNTMKEGAPGYGPWFLRGKSFKFFKPLKFQRNPLKLQRVQKLDFQIPALLTSLNLGTEPLGVVRQKDTQRCNPEVQTRQEHRYLQIDFLRPV